MAKLNGKGKAATWAIEQCSRNSHLNPPVKLLCNLGMQYLPDRFPPPASTGSWSSFLGIVHSWGDSALQQTQARRTLWYRWGYWLFFAFFLKPIYLRPLLWHCAPSERRKIIHSWIWWQCHLQNHSPEHVWGHWSRILLSFFVFCYILCGPLCWFIPKARSRCVFSLSFMWAVTCTCPSYKYSYPSRLSHRAVADCPKLIDYYNQLSYNVHHKK